MPEAVVLPCPVSVAARSTRRPLGPRFPFSLSLALEGLEADACTASLACWLAICFFFWLNVYLINIQPGYVGYPPPASEVYYEDYFFNFCSFVIMKVGKRRINKNKIDGILLDHDLFMHVCDLAAWGNVRERMGIHLHIG